MGDTDIRAIALVGPLPPPAGGMANQTRQLASLLRREGMRVELVQVNASYAPAWVGRIRGVRAVFRLAPYIVSLWRAAGRADIVHVMANSGWSWQLYAAPAVWIAWLRRKPAIVNYRGGEAETFFAKSWLWVRPTMRRARAVIVPSGYLESIFEKHGIDVRVVPNIVDLERFTVSKQDIVARRSGPGWPHIVVTRNLEPIYDIGTALRAFAVIYKTYPAARLTIAGSGPGRDPLQRLAEELAISPAVAFSGRLENASIEELYREADLMLNPSVVDNMPNSILEALASGVPVVSTAVGGIPYLVEDGKTAMLVPPRDPARMAEAALALLADAGLAGRFANDGLELVKQFGWEPVRVRLFEVYSEVESSGPGGDVVEPTKS